MALAHRATADVEEITTAIRGAIVVKGDLYAESIVLLKPLTLPKTSSGKVQRGACRSRFLEGVRASVTMRRLEAVGDWIVKVSEPHVPHIIQTSKSESPQAQGRKSRHASLRSKSPAA